MRRGCTEAIQLRESDEPGLVLKWRRENMQVTAAAFIAQGNMLVVSDRGDRLLLLNCECPPIVSLFGTQKSPRKVSNHESRNTRREGRPIPTRLLLPRPTTRVRERVAPPVHLISFFCSSFDCARAARRPRVACRQAHRFDVGVGCSLALAPAQRRQCVYGVCRRPRPTLSFATRRTTLERAARAATPCFSRVAYPLASAARAPSCRSSCVWRSHLSTLPCAGDSDYRVPGCGTLGGVEIGGEPPGREQLPRRGRSTQGLTSTPIGRSRASSRGVAARRALLTRRGLGRVP